MANIKLSNAKYVYIVYARGGEACVVYANMDKKEKYGIIHVKDQSTQVEAEIMALTMAASHVAENNIVNKALFIVRPELAARLYDGLRNGVERMFKGWMDENKRKEVCALQSVLNILGGVGNFMNSTNVDYVQLNVPEGVDVDKTITLEEGVDQLTGISTYGLKLSGTFDVHMYAKNNSTRKTYHVELPKDMFNKRRGIVNDMYDEAKKILPGEAQASDFNGTYNLEIKTDVLNLFK